MRSAALEECLTEDLRQTLPRVESLLSIRRARGRSLLGDAAEGAVIEEGEAEGLLAELQSAWAGHRHAPIRNAAHKCISEPLVHAIRAFDLHHAEQDALLLALGVELDFRFSRLIAFINDHLAHTRPSLGLLQALAELDGHCLSLPGLIERPVFRDGLLERDLSAPLPGQFFKLAPDVLTRLCGKGEPGEGTIHEICPPLLNRLVLSERVRHTLAEWVARQRVHPERQIVFVSGPRGVGKTVLAHAAASLLGLSLYELHLTAPPHDGLLRLARREGRWFNAAILLVGPVEGAIDWKSIVMLAQDLAHPLFIEMPAEAKADVATASSQPLLCLDLTLPDTSVRAQIWRATVGNSHLSTTVDWYRLADRFPVAPKGIALFASLTRTRLLAGTGNPLGAVEEEFRNQLSTSLRTYAQQLPLPFTFKDLIVPERVLEELRLALAWVAQRRKVLADWNFGEKVFAGRGLTALFHGSPGTGKTMAAQVLARELGVDLFRIDLSQVMSKFIGETEKNLARLFDAAQDSGAMLFFDEADAIFGKRTEVKDAHDRHANVEISYLLQRMEQHEGVTVLATNRFRDLDEAFRRRFHFILDLPMPDAPSRLRIWQGMLPSEVELSRDHDLDKLAKTFELSGGEIRNCVLTAAYLAADRQQPLSNEHFAYAIRRELTKNGRLVDESIFSVLKRSST